MSLLDLFSRKKTCDLLVNVDGKVVEKYRHFKDFLTHNRDALNTIAAAGADLLRRKFFQHGIGEKTL